MERSDTSAAVAQGLSSADAAARLARDGRNVLPRRPPVPLWRRVVAQLRDPLVIVLLVAAALTVATGDRTDMAVILLVIVVNTTVGVGQEIRADHAISVWGSRKGRKRLTCGFSCGGGRGAGSIAGL